MSAKRKKKERPTFVAENGNMQNANLHHQARPPRQRSQSAGGGVKRAQFLSPQGKYAGYLADVNKNIFLLTALPRPAVEPAAREC